MGTLRIQEFAQLAGVTVRALRHYDRLRLLSPAHRSEKGYRLYCHEDLGRLERILVLRFLGLSLREIAALLDTPVSAERLSATLARQRAVLRERRDGLDRVLRAVEHAQLRAQDPAEPEWLLYQTILKEIQMQENQNWTEKYYTPQALEALHHRKASITPEQGQALKQKWQDLYADIQTALDRQVPPDSEEGRTLVARWMHLADEFTQGNPDIEEGVHRLHQDQKNWPDDEKAAHLRANSASPEQRAFFLSAVHACLRHG